MGKEGTGVSRGGLYDNALVRNKLAFLFGSLDHCFRDSILDGTTRGHEFDLGHYEFEGVERKDNKLETGLTKVALESICLSYLAQTQEGGAPNCSQGVVEYLRHGDWLMVEHVNRVVWDHRSSFKAISII